jgi:hypothetical protein
VIPPSCCDIQCLQRRLETRGAERSEGREKHRSLMLSNHASRFLGLNSTQMGRLRHNIENNKISVLISCGIQHRAFRETFTHVSEASRSSETYLNYRTTQQRSQKIISFIATGVIM